MVAYVRLDMLKIAKVQRKRGKADKDPLPETLAALDAGGFRRKYHQGRLFTDHGIIRGTVAEEAELLKLRSIPFVIFARKVS